MTVPDSSSLDLTTGMTLEAWVKPTAAVNSWRTVVMKENASNYAYGMYAGTGTGVRVATASSAARTRRARLRLESR